MVPNPYSVDQKCRGPEVPWIRSAVDHGKLCAGWICHTHHVQMVEIDYIFIGLHVYNIYWLPMHQLLTTAHS